MEGIARSKYIETVLAGILSKLLCWTQGQNSCALPLRTLQVEWQRAASSRKGSKHERSGIWFCSRIHVFAWRWRGNVRSFRRSHYLPCYGALSHFQLYPSRRPNCTRRTCQLSKFVSQSHCWNKCSKPSHKAAWGHQQGSTADCARRALVQQSCLNLFFHFETDERMGCTFHSAMASVNNKQTEFSRTIFRWHSSLWSGRGEGSPGLCLSFLVSGRNAPKWFEKHGKDQSTDNLPVAQGGNSWAIVC